MSKLEYFFKMEGVLKAVSFKPEVSKSLSLTSQWFVSWIYISSNSVPLQCRIRIPGTGDSNGVRPSKPSISICLSLDFPFQGEKAGLEVYFKILALSLAGA